ncbi:MAG: polyprenyl synthetase family protein, partial [Bacteroidota bacterium]
FGKQVGGDIVSNKKTYLLIKALQLSSAVQKKELNRWLEMKEFDAVEKVDAVKTIYGELKIDSLTSDLMNQYYDEAFKHLKSFEAREEGKHQLSDFFQKLMNRDR